MRLDFYYFSWQCPLNATMLKLLEEYRDQIEIHLYDISKEQVIGEEDEYFFPNADCSGWGKKIL